MATLSTNTTLSPPWCKALKKSRDLVGDGGPGEVAEDLGFSFNTGTRWGLAQWWPHLVSLMDAMIEYFPILVPALVRSNQFCNLGVSMYL